MEHNPHTSVFNRFGNTLQFQSMPKSLAERLSIRDTLQNTNPIIHSEYPLQNTTEKKRPLRVNNSNEIKCKFEELGLNESLQTKRRSIEDIPSKTMLNYRNIINKQAKKAKQIFARRDVSELNSSSPAEIRVEPKIIHKPYVAKRTSYERTQTPLQFRLAAVQENQQIQTQPIKIPRTQHREVDEENYDYFTLHNGEKIKRLDLHSPKNSKVVETRKVELAEVLQELLNISSRTLWNKSMLLKEAIHAPSNRSVSAMRPTTTSTEYKKALNESYSTAINKNKLLYHSKAMKPFCPPQLFNYGRHFRNKSEQDRHNKVANEILTLRYLLNNDNEASAVYVTKFLKSYLTQQELSSMTEKNVTNLLDAIINTKDFNANLTLRDFVMKALQGRFDEIEAVPGPVDAQNTTVTMKSDFNKSFTSKTNRRSVSVDKSRENLKYPNKFDSVYTNTNNLEQTLDTYLKKHEIHNIQDTNFPSVKKPIIEGSRPLTSVMQEDKNNAFTRITKEEGKTSVMKRNRLLLEYVMKSRATEKKNIEMSISFYNSSKNKDNSVINEQIDS